MTISSHDRRTWLRAAAIAALTAGLAACGFELQRTTALPFKHLQLAGFDARSTMAAELKRQINATGSTTTVETMAKADVILLCLRDSREKVVAASTAFAQVRDLTLVARLKFMVRTPDGRVLITPTEVALNRDMDYNETNALAKDQEADMLFRAMQSDIANQILRRLAAVKTAAK